MSDTAVSKKLPKPQLRGLLQSQIKRNLLLVGITCTVAGIYMKFVFGQQRKNNYAEFYKNLDVEKMFEEQRKKGLFDSCPQD